MVEVLVSGNVIEDNPKRKSFEVIDEYGFIQPVLFDFGDTIQLEAKRDGADKDGRKYTIQVIVEDMAGNISKAEAMVVVPHDKGK